MSEIAQRLLAGEQRALSRLITMLERGDPAAADAMKVVDGHTGRAYTVGITGPPGAGKSTIVDQLTQLVRKTGSKVGIIAVDPTSPFSGGAILGDRIRMQRHYLDSGVFIRSVATRGQTGGLPRVVKSMVRALDAAGTDLILVETVGVGQTELGIISVADTVLVALNPESGDAIQTLKAGVMEIADVYLVNKADRDGADQMATAIIGMLHMSTITPEWSPPVLLTNAQTGQGIEELWVKIQDHREFLTTSGGLKDRRETQRKREFLEAVEEVLSQRLRNLVENDPDLIATLEKVAGKETDPYSAALEYLDSSRFSSDWLNAQ
ncbi:MAG: methylmalonyl Co-A mutase-associated GTPase MeaB [SAR202 cluster bacterium]|nr:methylmalonyl Co-A mutase-associated GTPase MeaB [SAR202 cluster bacterium]